jgi:hypothetical protein
MVVPQKKAVILPPNEERRRFQRVRVSLLGRYLPADRREDFLEERHRQVNAAAAGRGIPAADSTSSAVIRRVASAELALTRHLLRAAARRRCRTSSG